MAWIYSYNAEAQYHHNIIGCQAPFAETESMGLVQQVLTSQGLDLQNILQ